MFGVRVEVVPDNDAEAHPDIPHEILDMLDQKTILMSNGGHMMYIRQSHWERVKHRFGAGTHLANQYHIGVDVKTILVFYVRHGRFENLRPHHAPAP